MLCDGERFAVILRGLWKWCEARGSTELARIEGIVQVRDSGTFGRVEGVAKFDAMSGNESAEN